MPNDGVIKGGAKKIDWEDWLVYQESGMRDDDRNEDLVMVPD